MVAAEHREEVVRRVTVLAALVALFFVVVVAGYLYVQIVEGPFYRQLSENNRLRQVVVSAPRGQIRDRQGRPLVENTASYNLLLHRNLVADLDASLDFATDVLGRTAEEIRAPLSRSRELSEVVPVLMAEDLALSQVARFEAATLEYPEFEIQVRHRRLYRHGRQTAHVLGYLREVSQRDLSQPETSYTAGDVVGKAGIEGAYDPLLRGRDGERVVVVDSRGKLIEEYRREDAESGQDVVLTLDLDLQQEAELGMRGRVGVVVALDPRDGAIRALVSTPSYDPNLFAGRLNRKEWNAILKAPHHPLQNRAIQNTYSPGSVFKPVLALAALSEGIAASNTVRCRGSTQIYNHRFRCWRSRGHGRVNLHQALQHSCDVYFYHLGKELGIETIGRYARLLGFGEPTEIDIAGEKPGLVPDPEWSLRVRKSPWYPGETISVAIGQGPLLTTPLQIATMMAALANGGYRVTPHLVRTGEAPKTTRLPLDAEALEVVRRALWAVVNDGGTGAGARLREVEVAGKTGTAQVIRQETWVRTEELPYEQRDHAWFASFAPFEAPELVVVIFVEHGGMGSRAAAPLAKLLYERYFTDRRPSAES